MTKNLLIPAASLVIACLAAGGRGLAAEATADALAQYVAKADDSFAWRVKGAGTYLTAEYSELILTSQTWRGVTWKHQLYVLKPQSARRDTKHALLLIAGGNWDDRLERQPTKEGLPREMPLFVAIAERLKTPVAVLKHVPQQPMFDGRREDAIIALTFAQFIKTGQADWPLLLPMVKSAVRAMDVVQKYAADEWSQEIRTFSVTGASKRGWTTWLTGAVDPRAAIIAPMVIDMLNMKPQLDHQQRVWGEASYKISDYTELGLHQQLDTPAGRALQSIVDPYAYRDKLKQPKLIILGTNDHYWPLDALNFYWNDLVGEKYILYVPNNRHGITDYGRVVASVNAMHQSVANGLRLPKLDWKFENGGANLRLRLTSDLKPRKVVAWVAKSDNRDFRDARWQSYETNGDGSGSHYELAIPQTGYAALFGEAVYESDDGPYYFSTNVQVVGAEE